MTKGERVQNMTINFDPEYDLQQVGITRPSEADFSGPDWLDQFDAAYDAWDKKVDQFYDAWCANAKRIGTDRGFGVRVALRSPQFQTTTPTGDGDTWERIIWQETHDATPVGPIAAHRADAGW